MSSNTLPVRELPLRSLAIVLRKCVPPWIAPSNPLIAAGGAVGAEVIVGGGTSGRPGRGRYSSTVALV